MSGSPHVSLGVSSDTPRVRHTPEQLAQIRRVFELVAAVCIVFVVLTTLAMVLYPGGTFPDAATRGYRFLVNYFSDLGQTRTQSGVLNLPSMLLFSTALALVGASLGAFFLAFRVVLHLRSTEHHASRVNRTATRFGIVSAACFIGIGMVPENVFAAGHFLLVQGAFNCLMIALVLEVRALRRVPWLSAWLTRVNVGFLVVLGAYIVVLVFGPSSKTLAGDEINAVAQKIIVYLAIATIFAQALIARAHVLQVARQAGAGKTTR